MPASKSTHPDRTLTLKQRGLAKRTLALFAELAKDKQLQSLFIENPMAVLGGEVQEREFSRQQISAVNRFLFSVLSNEKLHKWASEQAREGIKRTPVERANDLAQAFIKFGDQSLMLSLIKVAESGASIAGLGEQASFILKSETYATGAEKNSWFIVKVSGLDSGLDEVVLPAAEMRSIAESLVQRAKQLQQQKTLASAETTFG